MSYSLDRTIAPPVANFSEIHLVDEQIASLSNGVDFHIINSGEQALSQLSLMWEGGTLDAPYRSLPSVVMESLQENSAKLTGAEIADVIDYCGARLMPSAATHYAGLSLLALNSRFDKLLPMLGEIILNPSFDSSKIEMITRKLASRKAVQQAKVSYLASVRAIQAIAGADHPEAKPDTPEIITSITTDDVQQAYSSIIGAGRLHAYLSGKFDDAFIAQVRSFLEQLPIANAKSIIHIQPHKADAPRRFDLKVADAQQSAVVMAMPTISRDHPDYIDLRMAIIALGGYFSSRLMSNIREEKGLTYGINSVLAGSHEGAYMNIEAQCDAAYVEQVIDETRNEIIGLTTNPLSTDELNRVKMHAWSSLANAADSAFSASGFYMLRLTAGTPDDYFERQLSAIKNLTSNRVAELASQYLNPADLRISVAGA